MKELSRTWTLAEALESMAQQLGLHGKIGEQMVVQQWRELVGEALANHAQVRSIRDGTMFITVEESSWRYEIHFNREALRRKINNKLGREIIKEIVVR
ncbi:MAG: DUF721 domain-containing protein [Chlorobi bacterium]|nr:DUF721 domain-containing protein [Chlorobiota bacterium]